MTASASNEWLREMGNALVLVSLLVAGMTIAGEEYFGTAEVFLHIRRVSCLSNDLLI